VVQQALVFRIGFGPKKSRGHGREAAVVIFALRYARHVASAVLTINSRKYGAWSLRGWLLCRFAELDFDVEVVDAADADSRAELLLLSPSFLVPALRHDGLTIWDTLAIAEYLNELLPSRELYPSDRAQRALCRSAAGEVHSGFANLRSALPMNLTASHPGFAVWAGARRDIDRIEVVWGRCLDSSGGPFLFGGSPGICDAMYAPECTRFVTYDVKLGAVAADYVDTVMSLPDMREWTNEAQLEADEVGELDFEF
jgi:glutathione S-transferase